MESTTVDILGFDATSPCEVAQELALKNVDDETFSGVTLLIIGDHADRVKKHFYKDAKSTAVSARHAEKSGKVDDFMEKTIDKRESKEIDGAAIRVTGWMGVKQEFNETLLKTVLAKNPHWVRQIVKFSENLGNFIK